MSLYIDVYCYPNGSRVSVNPGARINVLGKYVQLSFHPMLGVEFYRGDEVFNPQTQEEHDALWAEFGKWHKKFQAHEAKLIKQGKSLYRRIEAK